MTITRCTLSVATLARIEAALPVGGDGIRPIWLSDRLNIGYSTARHALRELVAQGRARFEGADRMRRYWRART